MLMEVVKSESIYFLHNKYDRDVMKRLICSSVKSGKPIFFFCEGIATSTIRREHGYASGSQNKVQFHKTRDYTVLQYVLCCG